MLQARGGGTPQILHVGAGATLASHAEVFRGARISSLLKTPAWEARATPYPFYLPFWTEKVPVLYTFY